MINIRTWKDFLLHQAKIRPHDSLKTRQKFIQLVGEALLHISPVFAVATPVSFGLVKVKSAGPVAKMISEYLFSTNGCQYRKLGLTTGPEKEKSLNEDALHCYTNTRQVKETCWL